MYRPLAYKYEQTTQGEIKLKLYAANIKLNNSVEIFIQI